MSNELFNVVQFFENGDHEYVQRGLEAGPAVERAKALTESVGGRLGTTHRVIITDGGDSTVFEWVFGEGVTFPTKEMRASA